MKPRSAVHSRSTIRGRGTALLGRVTTPKATRSTRPQATPNTFRRTTVQGGAQTTTNHEVIRRWVEERGGVPASIQRTRSKGEPEILRIEFVRGGRPSRDEISWDVWFDKFDEANLAFLYQEKTKLTGAPSRFFKLVKRQS